ncbi:hypothetical protein QA641_33295 [Bradyrhizobium sp. CB1650]|nr:hypothetical protein [Bradyrhizobium sp. CB1650]WGD56905.1 hypothetical protein QA641_33295 [Bradyrhizobium sp. CB1650]
MASAYAKFTGQLGVCIATLGNESGVIKGAARQLLETILPGKE